MLPAFLAQLETAARSLGDDAAALAEAHLRLARFEVEAALAAARRLALGAVVAAVLGIAALAVGTAAVAQGLDGAWGLSTTGWLALLAGVEAAVGGIVGWLAWRRFQHEYVGLADSQAELQASLEALAALWKRRSGQE